MPLDIALPSGCQLHLRALECPVSLEPVVKCLDGLVTDPPKGCNDQELTETVNVTHQFVSSLGAVQLVNISVRLCKAVISALPSSPCCTISHPRSVKYEQSPFMSENTTATSPLLCW